MKASEQYFHVVLIIMLYKVFVSLNSADEILVCGHSSFYPDTKNCSVCLAFNASYFPYLRIIRLKRMYKCYASSFPLQAYTSVRGAAPELKDNKDLAVLMNNVAFHSKLVDAPEKLLNEISDLSIFWLVT